MDMTKWIRRFLRMFYIVTPSEYNTESGNSIFREAWPFFLLFIILENIVLFVQRKSFQRFNDGVTSITHGIFYESGRIITRGAENWFYHYIYENYRLFEFQCDTILTWYSMAIVVDFFYYWVHRGSHEIHVLWAQHQVHHSAEDYNLTVGLRHPFLNAWCGFIFYLPMALFIPPPQFIIHQQFNLLYQFWIHTSVVNHLGPLEYVLNTPNHHRVHHGSNLIYLDKNYGGVLIIWDRLFGTFAEFTPKQSITYGIVSQPQTFNPFYLQVFYNKSVFNKLERMDGWWNKFQSIIKGPSWLPGRSWTGCELDKIDVQERLKYDPALSLGCKLYLFLHIAQCLWLFHYTVALSEINPLLTLGYLIYIMFSLTIVGMFFDRDPRASSFEIVRCSVTYVLINYTKMKEGKFSFWLQSLYGISSVLWTIRYISNTWKMTKTEQSDNYNS